MIVSPSLRVLALSLAILAIASAASAQEGSGLAAPVSPSVSSPRGNSSELDHARRGRPEHGVGEPFAAWLDEGLFSGSYAAGDVTLLGTEFGVRLGLEREARLSVDWGFAYAVAHVAGSIVRPSMPTMPLAYDGTAERVEARNPVISFEWLPWLGTNTRFSFGLAVAIPSAAIQTFGDANQAGPSTEEEAIVFDASRRTHEVWLAANGAWNAWRYQPERFALALPLALLIDAGPVEVALEGAVGFSIPVLGGSGQTDGLVQAAVELYGTPVRFDERNALSLGLRASIAGYHLGASTSAAQPSFEPWVRFDLAPAFLTVRGVLNVGDPFGVGTATGVWALHVGGGVAVE